MISSIISEIIDIMHLWNEAGALHNPKDILWISISSIGTSKSSFALVIRMDLDLMIARIPIKETKERMLCKLFQHLIDEG